MRMAWAGMMAAVSLGLPRAAWGDTAVFDFEGLPARLQPPSGELTSLTLTSSGVAVVLTRPGSRFDIVNTAGFGGYPASYGARALNPFFDPLGPTPFIGDFSQAVDGVVLDFGDFGLDADMLALEAFSGANATGTLLASATGALPGTPGPTFTGATLSLTAAGIRSIRFGGGSTAARNSVYYDNLAVTFTPTAIPEPSTLALCGIAAGGVALAVRRRRAA